ncbi:MAG: HlyC/CorC family transporter [Deltaproteobacteria bacterium]|nr:HlyC/CorC family transporter [Deltaproteobacteria bacterium]
MTPAIAGWLTAAVLAEGFFAGSEMALLSANRSQLSQRAAHGESGAARALAILKRQDRLLATCLIGTNLALVAGATVAVSAWLVGGAGPWVAGVYVAVALVFGEAVPKLVYAAHADTLAPVLVYPIRAAEILFTPFLGILSAWQAVFRRLAPPDRPMRRDEIVSLIDDRSSRIDPEDRRIIQRVFQLGDLPVEESMTPLVDLCALPDTATVAEAIRVVIAEGYSRIPVFRDRVDNLVGIVEHRDLLHAEPDRRLSEILRPVRFVPEAKKVDELLRELRVAGEHLAVVVDEYGGSAGIVTTADLLENLLGNIRDERDEEEVVVRKLSEREWRVQGRATVEEVSTAIGRKLPDGDYETVAGMLLHLTGRIPRIGEQIRVGRCVLVVDEASDRAIIAVRVQVPE